MSMQRQTYAERAQQCEQMAFRVRNTEAKGKFVQLARHWQALAAQEARDQPAEAAAASR